MNYELDAFHRNEKDETLLADILRVSKILGKNTLTIDEYNDQGKYHSTTLARRFGTWLKALEKAGLAKTRNLNIPDDDLFQNIVEIWARLGRQPRYSDMQGSGSKYSIGTYEKRYGGWRNALNAFVEYINEAKDDQAQKMDLTIAIEKEIFTHKTKRSISSRLKVLVLIRDGNKWALQPFECKG